MQGDIPYWGANGVVDAVDRALFTQTLVLLGEDGAPFFDRTKAVAFNVNTPVWVNNHIHVLQPVGHVDSKFLTHALNAADYFDFVDGSTRDKLTQGKMNQIPIPLPPIDTQRAIANFLDRKTASIDALIVKKERLIALLEEKRQALITQAVTKGLDPSVPMKDSGIEWLGEIPAHWEVKRLRHLVRESVAGPYGSSLTKAVYTSAGFKVYGQQQVIPDDFEVGDYYISAERFREMARYRVHPNDILVSVMGTVGRVAVVPDSAAPGIINPRLVRYAVQEGMVKPRWVQAVLMSVPWQQQLSLEAKGSTMDGLNMKILGDLPLVVPPPDTQGRILGTLRTQTEACVGPMTRLQLSVARLHEYRQALITEAVTGQLDIPIELDTHIEAAP